MNEKEIKELKKTIKSFCAMYPYSEKEVVEFLQSFNDTPVVWEEFKSIVDEISSGELSSISLLADSK